MSEHELFIQNNKYHEIINYFSRLELLEIKVDPKFIVSTTSKFILEHPTYTFENVLEMTIDTPNIPIIPSCKALTIRSKEVVDLEKINEMKELRYLHLNKVNNVPNLTLPLLSYLHVSHSSFTGDMLDLPNLKTLDILHSDLLSLKNLILPKLETLKINHSDIEVLPSLDVCTNLEKMNLKHNKRLSKFESIDNLHSLNEIDIEFCAFESLPYSLGYLMKLEKLDCSYNNLIELIPLHNVKNLNCSHNDLIKISYTCAETIDCSFNELEVLFRIHVNTRTIDCSHNKLIEFPKETHCLTHLNCSYNKLKTLPSLMFFSNINCSYNEIESVKHEWTFLVEFNCSYNKIKTLDLRYFESLKLVKCEGNDIKKVYSNNKNMKIVRVGTLFDKKISYITFTFF